MSTISAGTTSTTAFKVTGDTTGTLQLQTGATPTTAIDISASQVVSFPATTTLSFSGSLTLPGQTANGVAYLNGSKVLTSGSALTFDGTNFGVGTSSPSGKLDVSSSGNTVSVLRTTGAGSPMYYLAGGGGGTPSIAFNSSQALRFAKSDDAAYTNYTELMRLDSSGNLGIGTSSVSAKLHAAAADGVRLFQINGASYGLRASSSASNGMLLQGVDSTGSASYQPLIIGGSVLYFQTNGTTTAATLDSSGNLGLGVTPSAWGSSYGALQIGKGALGNFFNVTSTNGGVTNNAYYSGSAWTYQNSSYAGVFDFNGASTGGYAWRIAASGTAGNAISFTQAMTLDASGNLLAGPATASASGLLSMAVGNTTGGAVCAVDTDGARVEMQAAGALTYLFATTNHPLTFGTNNTERARIDSSGRFLVGTTSPIISSAGAGTIGGANGLVWNAGNSSAQGISSMGKCYASNSPSSIRYSQIAQIPASAANTLDYLHLKVVCNNGWSAAAIAVFEVIMGNRNGFSAQYTAIHGLPTSGTGIVCYQDGSGNTNVYAKMASNYDYIQVDVLRSYQMNAIYEQNWTTTAPTGTLVFDTGSPSTYPPGWALDNVGNLLIGQAGGAGSQGPKIYANNPSNTNGDAGIYSLLGSNCNNTTSYAFSALINGVGNKFYVYGNGNVVNTNNSYGAISDIKFKENVVDATPKLDDVMKLRVRNFNFKNEPDHKQIGFIAQEFEEVFPSMIDVSNDSDVDGKILETTHKTIKTSVLIPILVKAIQELKAELDALKGLK